MTHHDSTLANRIGVLHQTGSIRAAARALGMNDAALSRYFKRHGVTSPAASFSTATTAASSSDQIVNVVTREVDPVEYAQLRRQLARASSKAKQLEKEVKAAARDTNLADDVKAFLEPMIDANILPKVKPLPARRSRKGSPIVLVWHLTDLHWGEIVRASTIQDSNTYSPHIAARRIEHAVDTIIEIADAYSPKHYVEEIVVVVNGDTIGGAIHPESAHYYAGIVKQVVDVSMVLSQVMAELCSRFPNVRYIGTHGNHPRSTTRMPTGKARVETSWEHMIHEMVAAFTTKQKNLRFELAQGYTLDTYIGPSRWAFSHGDATKGGGGQLGIPAYGLKRQHDANREWSVVMAELTEAAIGNSIIKHTRTGHFHTYFHWQAGAADIALCPSPKGPDSYVKDVLGKYSPAMFLVEVVHPEHDVIAHHPINVQGIRNEHTETRYIWAGLTSDQPAAAHLEAAS